MLGFTKQEQGVILFLIFSLLVGVFIKEFELFSGSESNIEIDREFEQAFAAKAEEIDLVHSDVPRKSGSQLSAEEPIVKKSETAQSKGTNSHQPEPLKSSQKNSFLININSATPEELELIPRIGPVLAQRIIQYRLENGNFKNLEDLKEVKGIGDVTFNRIVPYISIGTKETNLR